MNKKKSTTVKNPSNIKTIVSKAIDKLGLTAIMGGYLALTLSTLAGASIWFDEAFSRYIIRFNFADIWHYTSLDVHPPLYYFALKVWSIFFGTSDFAIRSMSVFFGVLTLISLYFLVKRLSSNKKMALAAVLVTAFSPLFYRYSQEARMYTMISFLIVVAVRALYETFWASHTPETEKKWRRIYIVTIALAMWTQYLAALSILALWVLRAVYTWRETPAKKRTFKTITQKYLFEDKWLTTHLWAALLFLPWIPFFIIQAVQVKSGFWIPDINFTTIPSLISNTLFYKNANEIDGWLSLAAVAIIGFVIFTLVKNSKTNWLGKIKQKIIPNQNRNSLDILMYSAIAPVAILFLLSLPPSSSIFMDRYLLASVVFISAILAIVIFKSYPKYKIASILMVVVLATSQIIGLVEVDRLRGFSKTSWKVNETRQAIELIQPSLKAGEPIIAENVWLFYEAVQYTTDDNKVMFVDIDNYNIGSLAMLKDDDTFKIKDLDEFSKQYQSIWLIARPDSKKQKPLHDSWVLEEEILMDDSVTGKPLYSMQRYIAEN